MSTKQPHSTHEALLLEKRSHEQTRKALKSLLASLSKSGLKNMPRVTSRTHLVEAAYEASHRIEKSPGDTYKSALEALLRALSEHPATSELIEQSHNSDASSTAWLTVAAIDKLTKQPQQAGDGVQLWGGDADDYLEPHPGGQGRESGDGSDWYFTSHAADVADDSDWLQPRPVTETDDDDIKILVPGDEAVTY